MAELELHLVAERVAERAVAMLLEACMSAKRRWREHQTFDETDAGYTSRRRSDVRGPE
jgi:hypothetical protein